MSVGGTCGPNVFTNVREIGQTARLSSRSLGDLRREEGGYGQRDSTWSVRPADARAGSPSVVLADLHWLCRDGTIDQLDISLILTEHPTKIRGTQAPGIDTVSPDWKSARPDIAWVNRAVHIKNRNSGVLSAERRATSHHSARSPVVLYLARENAFPDGRFECSGRAISSHPLVQILTDVASSRDRAEDLPTPSSFHTEPGRAAEANS